MATRPTRRRRPRSFQVSVEACCRITKNACRAANPKKNLLVQKLGRALTERDGCTVLTASSWIEFNHVLAGNSPDIIFLDVNLPSIKGNRLSEVLKSQSNKKDIPIVLISDLPEKSLEEMFPSSGANNWMRKPLTRDKLVDMINRYVK